MVLLVVLVGVTASVFGSSVVLLEVLVVVAVLLTCLWCCGGVTAGFWDAWWFCSWSCGSARCVGASSVVVGGSARRVVGPVGVLVGVIAGVFGSSMVLLWFQFCS